MYDYLRWKNYNPAFILEKELKVSNTRLVPEPAIEVIGGHYEEVGLVCE